MGTCQVSVQHPLFVVFCSVAFFCTIVCVNQMRFVSLESHIISHFLVPAVSLGRTLACRDVETSLGCLVTGLMCL